MEKPARDPDGRPTVGDARGCQSSWKSFSGAAKGMEAIETQILDRIRNQCGGQPKLDDSLAMLGIDSVGMAELTFDLEKQFAIKLGDDVLDVETIRDLVDYVSRRIHR
ncbi:MAG: acyl carrier protein [Pirellulaceae bacterium]